jgi:hypothetical protein
MNLTKLVLFALFLLPIDGFAETAEQTEQAMDALKLSKSQSVVFEYGGLIYRYKGVLWITPPRTDRNPVRVGVDGYAMPASSIVEGIYHTHPCVKGYDTHEMSEEDMYLALTVYKKPMYMLDLCTGNVHVWDSTKDTIAKSGGRIIGRIPL